MRFCRSGFSRELFLSNRDTAAIPEKGSRRKPLLQKQKLAEGC